MESLKLPELINQVDEQERSKRDFIVDTRAMLIGTENNTSFITIPTGRNRQTFRLNNTAMQQMASRLNIPLPFAERLRTEEPALYDRTFNTLLHRKDEQRLVRTSNGDTARAYLSPNYRILDNDEFMRTVLPILSLNPHFSLQEGFLSKEHLMLSILIGEDPKEVRVGDPVKYGLVLMNSEVGLGSLSLSSFIHRLVCSNGLIVPEQEGSLRRIHLGKRVNEVNDNNGDRTIWREYAAAIKEMATGKKFPELMERIRQAAAMPLTKAPEDIVEELGKRFNLSKDEKTLVQQQYEASFDHSQWSLANAVTETAKEAKTIQRRSELQTIGGRLLPASRMMSAMAA